MAIEKTGVRKALTRVLAAGSLLAVYAVGTVATSGVFIASTTTSAEARGRGPPRHCPRRPPGRTPRTPKSP